MSDAGSLSDVGVALALLGLQLISIHCQIPSTPPQYGERQERGATYIDLLHVALLEDLLHDVLLLVRAELILEHAVRRSVEDTLVAVPISCVSIVPSSTLASSSRASLTCA